MPGGNGNSNGSFNNAGNNGNWWSSSENNGSYAYYRYMSYDDESANWRDFNKPLLFSVRCLQD